MDWVIFSVFAVLALAASCGVVLSRNPVHSALCLVATLFSMAVFFVVQQAHFVAAVQVIVYAGAIVVLFLFVIMLLGVDRREALIEPLRWQRGAAAAIGGLFIGGLVVVTGAVQATGGRSTNGQALAENTSNVHTLAESLFSDFLWPFEITSVLLVIAVVGAVVLAGKAGSPGSGSPGLDQEEAAR